MKTLKFKVLIIAVLCFALLNTVSINIFAYNNVWSGATASGFASGIGSQSSPYIIKTAEQLKYLADRVNSGANFKGWYFKLANDIYLNDSANWKNWVTTAPANIWTPIGTDSSKPFSGIIDGNNCSVFGVYTDKSKSYQGLFGFSDGKIMNLNVEESYVSGVSFVAGICGYNSGTVRNCTFSGAVGATNGFCGGICGINTETIKYCVNNGAIVGNSQVGGICGLNSATVSSCYNCGTIVSIGAEAGGICGISNRCIENCFNINTVVAGTSNAGGICGTGSGTIDCCYNLGEIGGGSNYVGGICGKSSGTVSHCYYLEECAADGNKIIQGGIGCQNVGSSKSDTDGETLALNADILTFSICYNGFDFDNDWTVNPEGEYPYPVPVWQYETICDIWNGTAMAFAHGDGTVENPYVISTAEELAYLAQKVNGGENYLGEYFVMSNDIYLNNISDIENWDKTAPANVWTPIGIYNANNCDIRFWGNFNGNGFTVYGVYTDSAKNYQGLFGYTTGTIKNLSVEYSWINGNNNVGGISGRAYGNISNCHFMGIITANNYAGGICGYAENVTITDSYVLGEINAESKVGGICGFGDGYIIDCFNSGTVTGNISVGGISGDTNDILISSCFNEGTVNGEYYVGGICGSCNNYPEKYNYITKSFNKGIINGVQYVGGLCGYLTTCDIEKSYNVGTVTGSSSFVGGICGCNGGGRIKDCYYMAGCAKDGENAVQSGMGCSTVGSTTPDNDSVMGLSDDQMKSETSYSGFDFKNEWAIESKSGYEYPQYMRYLDKSFGENSAIWTGTVATHYSGGSGSASNPYIIKTAEELAFLAYSVNSGNYYLREGLCFKLANDIKFNDTDKENWILNASSWTAIGNSDYQFEGIFDGNGYTISGLYSESGLFGISDGTIKNLSLEDSYICGNAGAAGICSSNRGSIINCRNSATIVSNGKSGGISAYSYKGSFVGCYNTGTIMGVSNLGGICADYSQATFTDCYNTGSVIGLKENVGGICGNGYKGSVSECYNAGYVIGYKSIGGIIGYDISSTVADSYNTGYISGSGYFIGGISGSNYKNTISNCYNLGMITGNSNNVGNICGDDDSTVSNCYYRSGSAYDGKGKLQNGFGNNTIGYSHKDASGECTALTIEQAKLQSSYTSFDFNNIWSFGVSDNFLYPTLKWQTGAVFHTHVYNTIISTDEYVKSSATCTSKAVYYYACACGEKGTETVEYGEKLSHTYDQKVIAAKYLKSVATCTQSSVYYYSCTCGEKGSRTFEYGYKLAHTYNRQVTTEKYLKSAATCTSKAVYYYSCACGAKGTLTFEYGDITSHTFNVKTPDNTYLKSSATCTSPALYYYHCSCGSIGTKTFEYGEKLPHSFVNKIVTETYLKTAASCTSPALYYYSCTCGEKGTATFKYGEKLSHTYNQKVITYEYMKSLATADSNAIYYYSCICGEKGTETFEYVDIHTHVYDRQNTDAIYLNSAATCTSKALYYYSCLCGAKGSTTFEYGQILSHLYNQTKTTSEYLKSNATCTSLAIYYYSCICGKKGSTTFAYGYLLPHTYNNQVTNATYLKSEATCTSPAIYYFSCNCGAKGSEIFEYGQPLSHTYNQKKISSEYLKSINTCTTKAIYYYSCICGAKGSETFEHGALLAHTYNKQVTSNTYLKSAATCTTKAVYYYSCVCGAKGDTTFEYGDKLAHTYDRQVIAANYLSSVATCTSKALYCYSCTCGARGNNTFEYGEKLAHKSSVWIVDKEATTVEAGLRHKECTVCFTVLESEEIPKIVYSAVWDGTVADKFESGTGTEDDPYIIKYAQQLAYLAQSVNSGTSYKGQYINLANDIYLNNTSVWENWSSIAPANIWTPIGDASKKFKGVFNGNSFSVFGIYTDQSKSYRGLFGYSEGTISNVSVKQSYISGCSDVGGICGYVSQGNVINCHNYGKIKITDKDGGGIVGFDFSGQISNCTNYGVVTGVKQIAGICGYSSNATVSECKNEGTIIGSNSAVGGILGYVAVDEIMNCCNFASVSGGQNTGGICGYGIQCTVYNCYNTGAISGGQSTGGINGYSLNESFSDCFNCGTIIGNSNNVGGIIGSFTNGAAGNCYNANDVKGGVSSCIGALFGCFSSSTAEKCYYLEGSAKDVNNVVQYGIGAFVNTASVDVDGQTNVLSEEQMKEQTSFIGFDFDKVWTWGTISGYSYPTLRITSGAPEHIHAFNKNVTDSKYLKSVATCKSKAVYYYSCECGEKGTATFEYGEKLSHTFDKQVVSETYLKSAATCTSKAVYYYSCECGEKGTETFEYGEKLAAHTYNKQVTSSAYLKSAATCTSSAIYYYSCSCGAKGSETFEYGSKLAHTPGNWIIDKQATYEETGLKHKECIFCGIVLENEVIQKIVDSPVWDGTSSGKFESGIGTEDDPYIIKTPQQLAYLAQSVNSGTSYKGKYIELVNDVYLNNTSDWENWSSTAPVNTWTPIGENSGKLFEGVFNGNGFSVFGIYTDQSKSYRGLFGYSKGTISNVSVKQSYIFGYSDTGAICGCVNYGFVTNCHNYGKVKLTSKAGGGISGSDYLGQISNCTNYGTVIGSKDVAGICGYVSNGTISYCNNDGAVTGNNGDAGGILGYVVNSKIYNCSNLASINGGQGTGGIYGYGVNCNVYSCYNTGAISGGQGTGGISGYSSSDSFSNCFNMGTIKGNNSIVGGISGSFSKGNAINCYNANNVTGGVVFSIGALFGNFSSSSAEHCYYIAGCAKNGKNVEQSGIGTFPNTVTDDVDGQLNVLTYEQMKKQSSFIGFDFEEVWTWGTISGYSYPTLRMTSEPDEHTHTFDKNITSSKYLKSVATCTSKAVYYYSCECGEKGTETFEYGEKLSHTFDKQIASETYLKSVATCTSKAVYYYSCICGEKGTETFEYGEKVQHSLGSVYSKDDTNHWLQCTVCGEKANLATHTYSDEADTTCNVCGYTRTVTKPVDSSSLKIVVESKTVMIGNQFTVTVSIEENPGFTYLEMTPRYAEGLTLVSIENGTIVSNFDHDIQYNWLNGSEDTNATGKLLTLTFTTSKDTAPGTYEIKFTVRSCVDFEEQNVTTTVETGTITVVDCMYGDANGDGKINGQDIVRLKKYLASYNYDTGTSTYSISAGADANGDGKINGQDIVRLKKYLASYNYDTGTSSVELGPKK